MNLLLDAHTWLWFHLGSLQLGLIARQHILDPVNTKFVSPASFWEISIKIGMGKYTLNKPYGPFMQELIVGQGFHVRPISTTHTELVATLPTPPIGGREHRNPFDRLLIAQATAEGMSLVSDDGKFSAYVVNVIW